jgi:hypothetical protein
MPHKHCHKRESRKKDCKKKKCKESCPEPVPEPCSPEVQEQCCEQCSIVGAYTTEFDVQPNPPFTCVNDIGYGVTTFDDGGTTVSQATFDLSQPIGAAEPAGYFGSVNLGTWRQTGKHTYTVTSAQVITNKFPLPEGTQLLSKLNPNLDGPTGIITLAIESVIGVTGAEELATAIVSTFPPLPLPGGTGGEQSGAVCLEAAITAGLEGTVGVTLAEAIADAVTAAVLPPFTFDLGGLDAGLDPARAKSVIQYVFDDDCNTFTFSGITTYWDASDLTMSTIPFKYLGVVTANPSLFTGSGARIFN